MKNRWQFQPVPEKKKIDHLLEVLGVDKRIARMLLTRGIETYDQAEQFFRPNLDDLHDPFLMKDMDLAVERIQHAMEEGEKVLIYGDYDVDGTTSVSLMVKFFEPFYSEYIDYYIPDRYKEGYGISLQGIDHAESNNISLIIALDCGIRAVNQVEYATKKGIDFIICDHHLPHGDIPKAVAVLDHKRADCPYPYKELTGCGIGLKLCQALTKKLGLEDSGWINLLDFVAISSACDIVPITGENRTLTYLGIEQINSAPRKGLESIVELSGKKGKFTVTDLVFTIGPRVNAAGRIGDAKKAVEMLLSEDDSLATEASQILEKRNAERKELDQSITQEALEFIEERGMQDQKTSVLFSESWHKGVVGIVASRLIESYYRPTIVLCESNGKAVGSARSVPGFNIHEALQQCEEFLEQYGGHAFAAGMTLSLEKVEAFQKKFEEVVSGTIDSELLIPTLLVDEEIDFTEITPKFWRLVKQLAPFGPENMKPVFVTRNVIDAKWSKTVGDGSHLKLDVYQRGKPNYKMSGIAFGMGEYVDRIKSKEPFDVLYTIEENEWQGNVSLQMMVKDLRFKI
ncbi:MAG: single-stranded-DNA-specific exonuclease RecJ [Crocinitomicaceae bacterium]|nr:single-stranded-DNA-specific exonuclease RecJ [Crocinitomicaceae bacterium]|tara:strand:- start:3498 stop:5210 length:1713 start_codon:yes stop_codon:yes gene_type:complete